MESENLKVAKTNIKSMISEINLSGYIYNGVIDITEVIDFMELAEQWELSQYEYEDLISCAQDYVDNLI